MTRATAATAWLCAATATAGWGCGAGGRYVSAAEARAEGETPSVEVALDRLEDLRVLGQQLDDLALRTPVGAGAPWAGRLASIPSDRASALAEEARNRPPYDLVGSRVAASRVYVLYNDEILSQAAAYPGEHASLMDALAALGSPGAARLRNKYEGVKASRSEMAGIAGTIAGLESEAAREATQPRRRAVIDGQIAAAKGRLESLALQNSTAEEALYDEIAAMKATGALSGQARALASTLFLIAQHAARMEEEALITSQLALLQLDRARPELAAELQSMGERLLEQAVREAGGSAGARGARVTVYMKDGAFSSVGVSGLPPAEIGAVQQSLMRRFTVIRDQIAAAANTAATSDAMARFERELFGALADTLGAISGNAFAPAAELSLPGVRAVAGAGPSSSSAWETPALPATAPPPATAPFPPLPGAPVPPPANAPGVPPPPFDAAASIDCPPALCGGAITLSSVGGIGLGMTVRDVAAVLGRSIAPAKDGFHAEPAQNVAGVILSFCGGLVCRIEITVNPPATRDGFGVDSRLAELAKTYGQSKCQPVDASRFGVEFEGMAGVLWISDRLNCEGIEDVDFWDRPLVGNVTSVIVGSPRR